MKEIQRVEKELSVLKEQLNNHELYKNILTIDHIRIFMESHVFAVWDFMSLLKALQQQLTCTQIPWIPVANTKSARFINEIVLEEETDVNEVGEQKSHFEMYVDAMKQMNADTAPISSFVNRLRLDFSIDEAMEVLDLDKAIKNFIGFTFDVIETQKPHVIASSFTFGREDIIPDMFIKIVQNAERNSNKTYTKLLYYLNRHIELDADDHGPLALHMIEELCGNDQQKWLEVVEYAKKSIENRIMLWDAINQSIMKKSVFA